MSFSNKVLVILTILLSLVYSAVGQPNNFFFRSDYTYFSQTKGFYKVYQQERNWHDAFTLCAQEGGSLFFPEIETEAVTIIKFVEKLGMKEIFLGIPHSSGNGVYKTIDGRPLSNNQGKCVVLIVSSSKYANVDCNKKFKFLCKKPLASLEWNVECDSYDLDYNFNSTLGSCYKFHHDLSNWRAAVKLCDIEQSYLAIINSQAEADFFVEMARKFIEEGEPFSGSLHLGFRRVNGSWDTIKDTQLPYPKWGYLRPDGGDAETCGAMLYNGDLNDVQCAEKNYFICERDVKNRKV